MSASIHDVSFRAPRIETEPGESFAPDSRTWQGIPGIERTRAGRTVVCWYSGGPGEGAGNYIVLAVRERDDGTWRDPALVVAPADPRLRCFDPVLWIDPEERLWLFWAQSFGKFNGRFGVWASRCEDPDGDLAAWTDPVRLCDGVMMSKPTVLSTGAWLLPVAVWNHVEPRLPELADLRRSSVLASTDRGETWERRGGADVPHRSFDEHMIVERAEKSLWMLVRTCYGIGESVSTDGGWTWSPGRPTGLLGPNSRFFIRRLASGALLLVNHAVNTSRSRLTAYLSENDGRDWSAGLLLDARSAVAYPDAVEDERGRIHLVYDYRRQIDGAIFLSVFSEEDILAAVPGREWPRQTIARLRPHGRDPHPDQERTKQEAV